MEEHGCDGRIAARGTADRSAAVSNPENDIPLVPRLSLPETERLDRLRRFVRGFAELVIDLELELGRDQPHDLEP